MIKYGIPFVFSWQHNSEDMPPFGLNWLEKLWWRFMPGVVINVSWPKDYVYFGPFKSMSTDPNDHYRPWLEKYVGRQRRDWNWGCSDDLIFIKFRKKKAKYATLAKLLWA